MEYWYKLNNSKFSCCIWNCLYFWTPTRPQVITMKFVFILMIVGTFTTTTVAGQNETEIKKLTKDQCRQVLREDFQNSRNEKTLKELFCEFLTYGFDNEESMKMAKTSLTNGDLDKNGVIDGEEIYGRPN